MNISLHQYRITFIRQEDGMEDFVLLFCDSPLQAMQAFVDGAEKGQRHFMLMQYHGEGEVTYTPPTKAKQKRPTLSIVK
jgi:hypothetical protein